MSRIGKKPVPVGAAKVGISDQLVKARRAQGQARAEGPPGHIKCTTIRKATRMVYAPDDEKRARPCMA